MLLMMLVILSDLFSRNLVVSLQAQL